MEDLRWILTRLKTHWYLILLALVGSLLQSAGASAVALTVKGIIDDVFVLKDEERLTETVSLLLGSAVVMQVGFFTSKYLISKASERTLRSIRAEIFRKLLYVPYSYFIKHPAGDLISRIVSDVEKTRQILVDHIPVLLREPLVATALLVVLLYRDPLLTLFLIIALPFMAFTVKYFGGKKGKHVKRTQESTGNLTQTLSQLIQGIENIKVFSVEAKMLSSFEEFNERIYRSSVRSEFYVAGNTAINYIFGYFVTALVILYGGFRIVKGHMSAGDFISYLTALFMIQPAILNTQKALMNLKGALPVVRRLREILSLPEETSGELKLETFEREIKFEKVSVKVGEKTILEDVNLTIKRGDRIGVVGHTGSGKSTLIRIIPRLIDYQGSVKIDGVELMELELKSLRAKIGFSTQETFLLNGTIRENLLIANPRATEAQLREALKLAVCDFVDRLEKGIDTHVGERGYTLSGGERQRLAIARLFLKDPDIVILDEATSALDVNTEKKLIRNIFDFFRGKTIIVVAHRLSNVMECERIVVLRDGRMVEEGNFYELLEKKGEFYRIFKEAT